MSLFSAAAKRLADALKLASGAAMVGWDSAQAYAAGTVGAAIKSIFAGPTFTGPVTLAGNAANALHAVPKQQLESAVQVAVQAAKDQFVIDLANGVSSVAAVNVDFTNALTVADATSTFFVADKKAYGVQVGKVFSFQGVIQWANKTGNNGFVLSGFPVDVDNNTIWSANVGALLKTKDASNVEVIQQVFGVWKSGTGAALTFEFRDAAHNLVQMKNSGTLHIHGTWIVQ
jgi:hypothetical protein